MTANGSGTLPERTSIAVSGTRPVPSRQRIHSTTLGQVTVSAVEPTTSPKCPALSGISNIVSTFGAARRIPRTAAGRPISSRLPTK